MNQAQRIACGVPFCQSAQEKQTNLSVLLRVTAVALGTIVAIVGILILLGVPGLSQLGTTVGWTMFSIGAFTALVGTSIKCVEKQSKRREEQFPPAVNRIDSESAPEKEPNSIPQSIIASSTHPVQPTAILHEDIILEASRNKDDIFEDLLQGRDIPQEDLISHGNDLLNMAIDKNNSAVTERLLRNGSLFLSGHNFPFLERAVATESNDLIPLLLELYQNLIAFWRRML